MHPEESTERVQAEMLGPNLPDWNIGDDMQVDGKQELLI